MDLGAIAAREDIPTDGTAAFPALSNTSKQNSDATGLRYQWGRKDGFTFPTSSAGGSGDLNGSLPVKIYDISSKIIPQLSRGETDSRSITISTTPATSNSALIKSPITFPAGSPYTVISQTSQTPQLHNYYWTSHSRGTDGTASNPAAATPYLDDYTSSRTKSLYDPCPHLHRLPSNGTYNLFPTTYTAWTAYSYLGGTKWTLSSNSTWLPNTGRRHGNTGLFAYTGHHIGYRTATPSATTYSYALDFYYDKTVYLNNGGWVRSYGITIRCIEDCNPQSDVNDLTY